ncbi:hypothetical protein Daura_17425 [Dactylosporangium aurantiacum]|uniref:Integral membrane protein n=1 Tax=Dactylosporangium aurantiacum TaxID=35754 RepID=A0A9Q9MKA8_9ACTN|nr:hypothetical protein [Dactylosporangium aurantiacum]MDG6103290.1 hypothetical protein [Dactylosporangium aurantiacum]UWZ57790.1 hypothetical protein Daura_17425 [Dactylosporangium aurantiacum]
MRLVLLYAAVAGLAVAASAVSATEVSLRCAAAASAVLAWQAATGARTAAPAVRWALAGGCALFAAAALVRQSAYSEEPTDVGWFGYGPPGTAELTAMRDQTGWWLGRELAAAGVQLGALVLCAGAVYCLPRARRRARAVVTVAAAALLIAAVGADRRLGTDPWEVAPALREIWPGVLAVVAGLTGLVLAGRRADHRWLVVAGSALVAVQAAMTLSDLTVLWFTWSSLVGPTGDAFLEPGIAISVATGEPGGLELGEALRTAVTLAGPGLLVHGALRAGTPGPAPQRPAGPAAGNGTGPG